MASNHLKLRHQILILDMELEKSASSQVIPMFVRELMQTLKMEKLSSLQICDATDARAPGWTFIQPITTSHISGHYFEKYPRPHFHLDIYSCKGINFQKVVKVTNDFFELGSWLGSFIDRELNPLKRNGIELVGKKTKILNIYTLHAQNAHTVVQEAKIKAFEKNALSVDMGNAVIK